ncbi:hypothetical protein KSC_001780 [Ktedonobacter sp. SOSP1-52]|uniref:hypothetical protein n=1 Tax=Ktedonobacter sp. SOSP1-52 TaxID=2778366 RepID=UPI001916AADB|nr:hypothetical protein [Ktedonobacter sp. SOSP1-52]GHO61286.1 hypothetical protein KSC_001780 [Ktedonobacter sp. SOSP1-52]
MRRDLPRPLEFVEKMILERRPTVWVALSSGGCGILTRAMVGKHDEDFTEARHTGLAFAYRVIEAIGFASSPNRVSTSQILVDTADTVINDPEHVCLVGTTWQCLPEGVEICSVGTTSVLVFEGDIFREVIIPHSATEFLRSQGHQVNDSRYGMIDTHALGGTKGCSVDNVRVARVPLFPTTTIAIIQDRRLANTIMQLAVPRNELPSFIEAWAPPGKQNRTSVLISL